jgi:N-acetyl-gamma-glutamyl-phosphate reductase
MNNKKISVQIIGASGYTGGELLRLLLNHPHVARINPYSRYHAGKAVWTVHEDLFGESDLLFSGEIDTGIDLAFLCMSHGESERFLQENKFSPSTKLIDLGNDHRLNKQWVYGLPELNRENIQTAHRVANPGCFATAIQLALLPLAKAGALESDIHISATTGSTGAGQSLSVSTHFSRRQNNMSVYKVFTHQHIPEILQSVQHLQNNFSGKLNFVPYRGSFTRGISANIYCDSGLPAELATKLYSEFYTGKPFVKVIPFDAEVKQVVNTNNCFLQVQALEGKINVTAVIDNLLNGASGQAVQNMNVMYGFEENAGLQLKGVVF